MSKLNGLNIPDSYGLDLSRETLIIANNNFVEITLEHNKLQYI